MHNSSSPNHLLSSTSLLELLEIRKHEKWGNLNIKVEAWFHRHPSWQHVISWEIEWYILAVLSKIEWILGIKKTWSLLYEA